MSAVAVDGALPRGALVGVVGAGAMGAGIAQVAALAGHPVRLLDAREGIAAAAVGRIRGTFDRLAAKGRLRADEARAASGRLAVADTLADFAPARLVVEAIAERLDAKQALFVELEAIVAREAILATNTSSISVTAIAAALRRPERVVGMHFFNPAPLMALVEVVSGLATAPAVAATVHDTAARWGKSPVHARSTPGFIVNRVARPFYAEGLRLLGEQAATPATVDAVMREAGGFRMGPFELMDLIGNDVNFAVTRSVFEAFFGDPRFEPSLIQQELVAAGRLGRKSGRGFFDHADGAVRPEPACEPPAARPARLAAWADGEFGRALAARLEAAGVPFERHEAPHADARLLQADDACVYLTDGRTATQRAADSGQRETVVVDLALDPASATRVALAASEACSPRALAGAVGALQSAGFAVSRLGDVPGLAVMRTVAMLANEAADAVNQGVCDARAVDLALRAGANHPRGPLQWADLLGLREVLVVLEHLQHAYGEDRYRASPLLRRLVAAGRRFHA